MDLLHGFSGRSGVTVFTEFQTLMRVYLCLSLLLVQNDFGPSKLFWSDPNCLDWFQIVFGQVQIILVRFKIFFVTSFFDFDLSKVIWSRPKQIGPIQTIGTRPKWFGSVEGQGISILIKFHAIRSWKNWLFMNSFLEFGVNSTIKINNYNRTRFEDK